MSTTFLSPTPVSFDDLLVRLATAVLLACAAWAVLIGLALLVELRTAGRVRALSWVGAPPALRRALLAGVGVALVGAAPGPVSATVLSTRPHEPRGTIGSSLPVPARPAGEVRVPRPRPPTDHVVRRGDTLWAIAGSRLPAGAPPGRVLRATQRWYAANARVIGSDPDLIRSGLRLHPPTTAPATDTEEHR